MTPHSLRPSPEADAATVSAEPAAGVAAGRLASLGLCTLLPSLAGSAASVTLPALASDFSAPFPALQWVVLSYLVATTAAVVGAGRLGDLMGRRSALLAGVALFTAASAACAWAPNLWTLVAARAVQGLGAAAMAALSLALVAEVVPKTRAGRAMGLLGALSAVGTALGPTLGGLLSAGGGWRAIFWALVALGAAAFAVTLRQVPASAPSRRGDLAARLHPLGVLSMAGTLALLALAMTPVRGAGSAWALACTAGAAAGAAALVAVEQRAPWPLVPRTAWQVPGLVTALVMTALSTTVVMATLLIGPFYLARSLGLGAAAVGMAMTVGPAVAALTGVPAGRAVDGFGAGRVLRVGLMGMAAGSAGLAAVPAAWGVTGYVLPLAVTTAGYALFQAANNTAVMAGAGHDQRGLISGLLTLARNLGLIAGASAMGAVFAAAVGSRDFVTASPGAVAAGMRTTFGLAAALAAMALGLAWWRSQSPQRCAEGGGVAGPPST